MASCGEMNGGRLKAKHRCRQCLAYNDEISLMAEENNQWRRKYRRENEEMAASKYR
jgi:hypothetical protein